MAVSGVNSSSYYVPDYNREIKQELDKDAFLQLLITQLANQDPTNPMEDREFIAQMAQFTSLEQMTNMAKQMENMNTDSSLSNQKALAVSYIGRQVEFQVNPNAPVDEEGNRALAMVQYVLFDQSEGVILGTKYGTNEESYEIKLDQVLGVGV